MDEEYARLVKNMGYFCMIEQNNRYICYHKE